MSNQQARLIGAALAMLAGAIACTADQLSVNIGLGILFVASALFVVEYVRAQRSPS